MVGLRERKKYDRRQSIIQAATRLIEREGLDNTTVEKIVAKTGIGVGTFYNYFQSKEQLVLEILLQEKDESITALQRVLQAPPEDPLEAILAMVYCFYNGFTSKYNKKMLRGLYRNFMTELPDYRTEGRRVDDWQITMLTTLLEYLQQMGQVRPDILPRDAGVMLFQLWHHSYLDYVLEENVPLEQMEADIRRNISYAFYGIKGV